MPRMPDLSKLSDKELNSIIAKAKNQKDRIEERTRAKARAAMDQIQVIVNKSGLSLDEIQALAPPKKPVKARKKKRRKKVVAKYANPANSRQTWSGRGPKPKWVQELLAGGKALTDLLIQAKASAEPSPQAPESETTG